MKFYFKNEKFTCRAWDFRKFHSEMRNRGLFIATFVIITYMFTGNFKFGSFSNFLCMLKSVLNFPKRYLYIFTFNIIYIIFIIFLNNLFFCWSFLNFVHYFWPRLARVKSNQNRDTYGDLREPQQLPNRRISPTDASWRNQVLNMQLENDVTHK